MVQFGAGSALAAQCPVVPTPDGWKPWFLDTDGPVPEALLARAVALAADQSIPLGTTESFPLPGVTTLIRVELAQQIANQLLAHGLDFFEE